MIPLLEDLDIRLEGKCYTSVKTPHVFRPPNLFGGAILYQLLLAGFRSVPRGFRCLTLSCNFIQGVSASIPVEYHVEDLRDGRNSCHRLVRAIQQNETRAISHLTFVRPKTRGNEPRVDPNVAPNRQMNNPMLNPFVKYNNKYTLKALTEQPQLYTKTAHKRINELGAVELVMAKSSYPGKILFAHEQSKSPYNEVTDREGYSWTKLITRDEENGTVEMPEYMDQLYQAYVSDLTMIYCIPELLARPYGSEKFKVSLDHDIHFDLTQKSPFGWMYSNTQLRKGADGRFLVTQNLFVDGDCVACCSQLAACAFDDAKPVEAKSLHEARRSKL